MKATTCKICHHKLTDPQSIANGVGPDCAERFDNMVSAAGLTPAALGISEQVATDVDVARFLALATDAMLAGKQSHVKHFKSEAQKAAALLATGEAMNAGANSAMS